MRRKGIIGKKIGMTTLFKEGEAIPVTLVQAGPCYVVRVLQESEQGKVAELGFEETKPYRVPLPQRAYFQKKNLPVLKRIKAFLVDRERKEGDLLDVSIFSEGERIDVRGRSMGRGFQGVVRRFGYKGGPRSHGSMVHRKLQSAGDTNPNKVHKGKGMPGRMGYKNVCVKNMQIVDIDREHNILALKGGVPGKKGSILYLCKKQ